jgi:hypothetical protein
MDAYVFTRVPFGNKTTPLMQKEFVADGTIRPVGCMQEIVSWLEQRNLLDKWIVFKDGVNQYMVNPNTKEITLNSNVIGKLN